MFYQKVEEKDKLLLIFLTSSRLKGGFPLILLSVVTLETTPSSLPFLMFMVSWLVSPS